MNKIKLYVALAILGFYGVYCSFTAHSQDNPAVQRVNDSGGKPGLNADSKFEFRALPYFYDALEPHIDAITLEIHYSKHHKAYYDKFIAAVIGTKMESMELIDIFKKIKKYPLAVRHNGGGHFNHEFYWESMKTDGGGLPPHKLLGAIIKSFYSFEEFKKQFSEAGIDRFGSGWVWLCTDGKGKLFVCSTPNQDNPLMDGVEKEGIPLLAMDVWEHAYYIKHHSSRSDYIDAFWNVVNWDEVGKRYEIALKSEKGK